MPLASCLLPFAYSLFPIPYSLIMTDFNQENPYKKLTITASSTGVETAKAALTKLEFESESNLAKSQRLSDSIVTKFFNFKPIQLDSFKRICQALKLKWIEIAGIAEEKESDVVSTNGQDSEVVITNGQDLEVVSTNGQDSDVVSTNGQDSDVVSTNGQDSEVVITNGQDAHSTDGSSSEVLEPGKTPRRKVTVVDRETETIKASMVLEGDIDSSQNLKVIKSMLRDYPGDTITISDIKKDRIRLIVGLIVEDDQEDIEGLVSQIKSGELKKLSGFAVQDIQILNTRSEDDQIDTPRSKDAGILHSTSQLAQPGRNQEE
ncbi:MAG: hypothetical protein F6K63_22830 [Moorea sp. SIO1G6]|uniref:hypothetical protein n=1 Tax=Moorena sp. SIO1G6 TaxID=2607840 RepID=UPI0013BF0DD7|nr:hypothetical protein [Moorena sp. SIO1G6]NET67068.1 hypothetical protein [Moorena sp. SIO1G6]